MSKYQKRREKMIYELRVKESDFTQNEMNFLYSLAKSKNTEHRIVAAELLVDCYTMESENILYHMTFDKDYLVQLNAIDSLCVGRTFKSLQRTMHLMNNVDYLIRGYAIMSHVDIVNNIYGRVLDSTIAELCKKLENEESDWVRAIIYRTIYILGDEDCLKQLIHLFCDATSECDYEVVWCLLNVFEEILSDRNYLDIKEVLISNYNEVLNAQKQKIDDILDMYLNN